MMITLSDSLTVLTGHVVGGIKSSLLEICFVIVLFLRRRKSAETMLEFVDHRLDLFLLPDAASGNKHKRHLVDLNMCYIFESGGLRMLNMTSPCFNWSPSQPIPIPVQLVPNPNSGQFDEAYRGPLGTNRHFSQPISPW